MGALRLTFLLLVLANLVVLALGRGYFGRGDSGHEPGRLDEQIMPERIVVAGQSKPAPAASPAPAPSKAAPVLLCRAAADVTAEQALALTERLKPNSDQVRITQTISEDANSWWVFLAPVPDSQANEARAATLRRLGISDFYVVRESGPNQNAISLGVYKTEAQAKIALAGLTSKGLKTARIAPRNGSAQVSLRVVGDEAVLLGLTEWVQAELPEVKLRECEVQP